MTNDAWICGIAAPYGIGYAATGYTLEAENFVRFIDSEVAADLKVDHEPIITHRGVTTKVGTIRGFASIKRPLAGLVCIGTFDEHEVARSMLTSVETNMRGWGLSLGIWQYEDDPNSYGIGEVSLTTQPKLPLTYVLATGPTAPATWAELTGEDVQPWHQPTPATTDRSHE